MANNSLGKTFLLCAPDVNMVRAWQGLFEADNRFQICHGTILRPDVDAWSTASDSQLGMGGGLDWAIRQSCPGIHQRAQKVAAELYGGSMPVGQAAAIPSGCPSPRWVILVPTMPYPGPLASAEPIYAAMMALMRASYQHPNVSRISVPAYGTGVGGIAPDKAAAAMYRAVLSYDEQHLS